MKRPPSLPLSPSLPLLPPPPPKLTLPPEFSSMMIEGLVAISSVPHHLCF
jgi:hypothetical protein